MRKKIDPNEIYNYWLKFHNTTVEDVIKKHPKLTKTSEWFKKYKVTQEQHDDWEKWCFNYVKNITKLPKKTIKRLWWTIYLNYAPSVKNSKKIKNMYITILDFEKGEIHSFTYQSYWGEDFDDIANAINNEYDIKFSENNCQWIIQDSLKLQIH